MTNDEIEKARVLEQDSIANEILTHLTRSPGSVVYPIDLVQEFRGPQRPDTLIYSAIWLLLDQHRARLNNRLQLELAGISH